jgi:hypothetical protein
VLVLVTYSNALEFDSDSMNNSDSLLTTDDDLEIIDDSMEITTSTIEVHEAIPSSSSASASPLEQQVDHVHEVEQQPELERLSLSQDEDQQQHPSSSDDVVVEQPRTHLDRPALLLKHVELVPLMQEAITLAGYASFVHDNAVWLFGGCTEQHHVSSDLLRFEVAEHQQPQPPQQDESSTPTPTTTTTTTTTTSPSPPSTTALTTTTPSDQDMDLSSGTASVRWSKVLNVTGVPARRAAFASATVIPPASSSNGVANVYIYGGRDGTVTLFTLFCLTLGGTPTHIHWTTVVVIC